LFQGRAPDNYSDLTSAKRFDFLDFIIVDVPADVLPWQE